MILGALICPRAKTVVAGISPALIANTQGTAAVAVLSREVDAEDARRRRRAGPDGRAVRRRDLRGTSSQKRGREGRRKLERRTAHLQLRSPRGPSDSRVAIALNRNRSAATGACLIWRVLPSAVT